MTNCATPANNIPAYGSPYATRDFGPSATGPVLSSTGQFSTLFSNWCATNPNLDAFINKGGRIIWTHGSADEVVSTDSSVDYYKQLVARYGQAKVDGFVRFYIITGTGHGDTGPFLPVDDSLQIVSDWVDRNIDPADNIAMGNSQPKSALDTTPGGKAQREGRAALLSQRGLTNFSVMRSLSPMA